jgi:hypothetical protein
LLFFALESRIDREKSGAEISSIVLWQACMVLTFAGVRITVNRASTPFHSSPLLFFMLLTIDTFVATVFIGESIHQWEFWALLSTEVFVILIRDTHVVSGVHDVIDHSGGGKGGETNAAEKMGSWFRWGTCARAPTRRGREALTPKLTCCTQSLESSSAARR